MAAEGSSQSNAAMAHTPHSVATHDRYVKTEKLGEGTYGVVYKAHDKQTDTYVALKRMPVAAWQEGVPATAMREISVLKEISHPNIVLLKDVFVSFSGNLYMVFELCDRDLRAYMESCRQTGMGLDIMRLYMFQLINGIDACHRHRITHRDIKPQNILLCNDGWLKVADFGLARTFSVPLRRYTHEVVTLWYRAPEILLGLDKYTAAVDSWSVGCIFAEMATGRPPFTGDSEIGQLFKIFQLLGTPNESTWPGVSALRDYQPTFPNWRPKSLKKAVPRLDEQGLDLLSRLLTYDPAQRITTAEALSHPYFTEHLPGLNKQALLQGDAFLTGVAAAAAATGEAIPRPRAKKRPASAAAASHSAASAPLLSSASLPTLVAPSTAQGAGAGVAAPSASSRAGHSKAPRRGGGAHGGGEIEESDEDLTQPR